TVAAVVPAWRIAEATGTLQGDGAFISTKGVDIEHVSLGITAQAGAFNVRSVIDRPTQSITVNAVVAPHPDWHEVAIEQLAFGTEGKLWTSTSPDILIRDS